MNNLKIGLELKKLLFKRPKGPGEYSYVIVATGKEVEGKNDVLELLKEDLESWGLLEGLQLKNESDDAFLKKIKKQISLVLFEDQYNVASGRPLQEPLAKKRKTEGEKEQCFKMKESNECQQTEEIEEVKNDRTSNPVECVTASEEDATDTKPSNVRIFHLAEIPAITETVEVKDEDDKSSDVLSEISTVNTSELFRLKCDHHRVLLFFVKKQISPKEVEKLFRENEAFEGVTDFQRTVTSSNKFKGVYLVSFSSEVFARKCVEVEVELNGILLDKILLRDYKREKFLLRQIQKTRSFKLNQDYVMDNLKDVKKDAKLDNCVVIQVNAEEEDVMEHFCGISSDFVDNFEFPVEEVKVITSPKIPQYVLVFESSEGAMSFKKQPEYHKVGEQKATVILLTERMKLVRFGEKIKNFVDDKSFSAADNDRRLIVASVSREASSEAVTSIMTSLFPDHKHLLRCEIDDFFWGLYVVTFSTSEEAETAAASGIEENEVIKNPVAMVLTEYCLQREHFLNSKKIIRRKRQHSNGNEENRWRNEFIDIEKRHEEYWGTIETKNDGRDNHDDSCDEEYNPMEMLKSIR